MTPWPALRPSVTNGWEAPNGCEPVASLSTWTERTAERFQSDWLQIPDCSLGERTASAADGCAGVDGGSDGGAGSSAVSAAVASVSVDGLDSALEAGAPWSGLA